MQRLALARRSALPGPGRALLPGAP